MNEAQLKATARELMKVASVMKAVPGTSVASRGVRGGELCSTGQTMIRKVRLPRIKGVNMEKMALLPALVAGAGVAALGHAGHKVYKTGKNAAISADTPNKRYLSRLRMKYQGHA